METRWENIEDNDYDEKPLLKTLLSELSERLKIIMKKFTVTEKNFFSGKKKCFQEIFGNQKNFQCTYFCSTKH